MIDPKRFLRNRINQSFPTMFRRQWQTEQQPIDILDAALGTGDEEPASIIDHGTVSALEMPSQFWGHPQLYADTNQIAPGVAGRVYVPKMAKFFWKLHR